MSQPNKKSIQKKEITVVNANDSDYLEKEFEKEKLHLKNNRKYNQSFTIKKQIEFQSIISSDEILNLPKLNTKYILKGNKIEEFSKDWKSRKKLNFLLIYLN